MNKLKLGYLRFDEQLVDHLQLLLENLHRLNDFEKYLVADRLGAFKEYKWAAVVSVKQHRCITRLGKGIKLLITEQTPLEKTQALNLIKSARGEA